MPSAGRTAAVAPKPLKTAGLSVDKLADNLKSGLVISDTKGKRKAVNLSGEQLRVESMRAVNSASQALSAAIQSGWKKSTGKPSSSVVNAAAAAEKHLKFLRQNESEDLGVERAAMSILCKLVSLEMYDEAHSALANLHTRLCTLLKATPIPSSSRHRLICIPLPTSETKDSILLTLTVTYLAYSLTILTNISLPPQKSQDTISPLESLAHALGETSLLAWISRCSTVPEKQLDALLTRAYTALTKACMSCKTTSKTLFSLRMYAVRCLALATPGTVESSTFWDQVVRFCGAFVKSREHEEEEVLRIVLNAFSELVHVIEGRRDGVALLSGKSFVAYCEYWLAFAKKAGDICLVDRIAALINGISMASSSSSKGSQDTTPLPKPVQSTANLEKDILWAARLCATLAQATSALDQKSPDLEERVREAVSTLKGSTSAMGCLQSSCDNDADYVRILGKLDRALERTRRAVIDALDPAEKSLYHALCTLLEELLAVLTQQCSFPNADSDVFSRCLDTFFVLARAQFSPSDPRTYIPAYDLLTKATVLLNSRATDSTIDCPNYLRCISGAFHNFAGTLYQAGRYGSAVGFLKDACSLGMQALETRRKSATLTAGKESKSEEGWRQLEEQLYRRWELLGICFLKNSDNKKALEAFRHSVETFPYATSGFLQRTATMSFSAIFELSSSTKQLAAIIDRVSNISASELLMEPSAVTLQSLHLNDPGVTGLVLERQIRSLESLRWKQGVSATISHLLSNVLDVYGREKPVRRARALLKCLEFMYHSGGNTMPGVSSPEEAGAEIEQLLDQNLDQDQGLSSYVSQYRVSAHLWCALHAHRRVDSKQSELVALHVEEACRFINIMLGITSELGSKILPKQVSAPKKTTHGPLLKQRSTRKVPNPREPVTPKSKSQKAQTVSPITQSPRRQTENKMPAIFDDVEKLVALLQLATHISGILAHVLLKVHLLDATRKLCDFQLGRHSDGYIVSSVDLACEFTKLGKTRRATSIFVHTLAAVRSGSASASASTYFFLRYAEFLAATDDVHTSASAYSEALENSEAMDLDDKGLPTFQRIQTRVKRLEMAAVASHVFALIQYSKEDVPTALDGMLRALRLWNRATESLLRLSSNLPSSSPASQDDNPFEMSKLKDTLPSEPSKDLRGGFSTPKKTFPRRSSMDGLQWRITEGLITTLFLLIEVYMARGSVREAEYFVRQAKDLTESLNAPALVGRALAKMSEIHLYQGHLDTSLECLTAAATLLKNTPGVEGIDVRRLHGLYNERIAEIGDASALYEESLGMIDELEEAFRQLDNLFASSRKSIGSSPKAKRKREVVLPVLLAAILRQRIWLLRDGDSQAYAVLIDKFLSLPDSSRTKSGENALMAKLTLHGVYGRFRADMFLSSLTESTIALPMGTSSIVATSLPPATQDTVLTLETAEKLFWDNLVNIAKTGNIADVREGAVSLALIKAFQTSLGKSLPDTPNLTASLLDASTAITLRREMLETIQHKFPKMADDDIQWPLISANGSIQPRPKAKKGTSRFAFSSPLQSDDDNEEDSYDTSLQEYWDSIRARYETQALDPLSLSLSQVTSLPHNWTVIHINATEDKRTLFITRQDCGSSARAPLIFCVPLNERRGDCDDKDGHLTFENAMEELKEIVRLSDKGTKDAINIKSEDHDARAAWWKERAALDMRLQDLLMNIEFCWLGAFKTILSPRSNLTPELIDNLRTQFEKVFHRGLHIQDKKTKPRNGAHKKSASQKTSSPVTNQVTFDDALLECFSTLSPKCRDEEIEDLVYFILDLYQFHGVPVAIAEVDVLQVALDLRTVLEDHAQRLSRIKLEKVHDEHLFLVLDKNLQGIPWESMPILRGRSVSRIPSIDFLHDRVLYAEWKQKTHQVTASKGAVIDPRKGFYILNPSGDLGKTEARFKGWAHDMETAGWDGISGHAPSEQQFLDALRSRDLVVYFGHGGGEQYIRSHKIRNLPTCAVVMLWGCSSGALREMGDFDRVGTPYNYMLAGSPCLVANLWDVTDRDIDKFSQSVFDRIGLTATGKKSWGREKGQVSIMEAVGQSRDSCKLKYLTGAAPVVYGIPFYL